MSLATNGRTRFGEFELDSRAGILLRDGWPVKIQPQPLRMLSILVERRGEIVSREELRYNLWGDATFVEFDKGLNYCARQIRLALRDDAANPCYVETLPKQGYRFIADVSAVAAPLTAATNGAGHSATPAELEVVKETTSRQTPDGPMPLVVELWKTRLIWIAGSSLVLAIVALTALLLRFSSERRSGERRSGQLSYTQITDLADSATAPALSPDGRMVAFFRSSESFGSGGAIYVKMLPNGEPKLLSKDPRFKYGLAFSADGSEVAYTVLDLLPAFDTYTVPVLGGEPRLFMRNAAGMTWLDSDHILFSLIRSGMHMGLATATTKRENIRDLYFPPHVRGMAHYSSPAPNRKNALVVEMDSEGGWGRCKLISMDSNFAPMPIGPAGSCRAAVWSRDGKWMYFTAVVNNRSHLWRQAFPDGQPEQMSFGAAEEDGLAIAPDGRSLVTSVGTRETSLWMHESRGERALTTEGVIIGHVSPPMFSRDGRLLYYLLERSSQEGGPELWRTVVNSGANEPVLPGVSMFSFDVSADGKEVVYSHPNPDGSGALWVASTDRGSPPRRITQSGETMPHFADGGKILFLATEGSFNYLEQINIDGSGRSKVSPYTIGEVQSVSPGRHWVVAVSSAEKETSVAVRAIPLDGGQAKRLCFGYCFATWAPNGTFLYVPVEDATDAGPGRTLALPLDANEGLPKLPPDGLPLGAAVSIVPGALNIAQASVVPSLNPLTFAYVKSTSHRNLFRVALP